MWFPVQIVVIQHSFYYYGSSTHFDIFLSETFIFKLIGVLYLIQIYYSMTLDNQTKKI